MRRTVGFCVIALIAGLASCQSDAPPTAAFDQNGLDALAADIAGVPECGFENGAACPVLAAEPRCDRGLQLIGTVPPLHLGGTCVNDTRHLVGAASRGTWVDWALANQRTLAVD